MNELLSKIEIFRPLKFKLFSYLAYSKIIKLFFYFKITNNKKK